MGILISQASMTTALAAMRASALPGTVSIQYSAGPASPAGMVYVATGRDLVALLRRNGWPEGREMRVQWTPSPAAPAIVMNEVRIALSQTSNAHGALGAQAYTTGGTDIFLQSPADKTIAHELTHVVQQGNGNSNN
jgi:hypothetical protein